MIPKIIIENILIISGEAFFLSSNFSQLLKLIRTRNPKGLYAPTQALNAAGNIAWVTYFATQKLWVPLSTNIAMLILTTITLAYLLGNKKQFLKGLVAIVILGPLTGFIIIKYPSASGWLGVIYNTIAATPWLVHIIRTKRTSGISEKSMYFGLGAILCTLTYALLIGSVPLIIGCVQGLLYWSIGARYYYRYRHI